MNHADTIINCTFAKQCNAQVCCVCASVRLRFHTMFVVGQTKLEGVKGLILFKVMYGTSECCSRPWADPLLLAAAAWMGKRCSESMSGLTKKLVSVHAIISPKHTITHKIVYGR